MLTSFSEFKFYQSFRIPVEEADGLRFLVELQDEFGKNRYVEDAKLVDISITGLGFKTWERISVGTEVTISLQFRKNHLDLSGTTVRAFSNSIKDKEIIYGIELDEEKGIRRFLENYVMSFSPERLKDCLVESALKERYTKASEGFEMFSLLLSLFKDITNFGNKEGFIENMLEEVVRILNAQRASIFLINPDTNELEAISALGVDKKMLRFDYRLGIAGSVFTTGTALNIDTKSDKSRFNEEFDEKLGFKTRSILCYPIHNREDKIIGVIEVLNKRNQDRFTVEDEKTMKVMALVFSSVFHNFNPISESSQIRRFSTPFDREYALIGKTPHVKSLRNTIIKTKDIKEPVIIQGERGVGKLLYAKILHYEGKRGLNPFEVIECGGSDQRLLEKELFGPGQTESKINRCKGGTVVLRNVDMLPLNYQQQLFEAIKYGRLPESKISMDVRIMATTTKDIGNMVEEGEFNKEFYDYLSRVLITMDSLRRRMDDLPDLIDYFLRMECKKEGLLLKSFSPKALERFKEYDWPGNINELRTCVERAVLYNPKSHVITDVEISNQAAPVFDVNAKKRVFGDIPHVTDHKLPLKDRLALVEREMIIAEIKRNNGNKSKAAAEMGISREALRKKLLVSRQIMEVIEKVEDKGKKAA